MTFTTPRTIRLGERAFTLPYADLLPPLADDEYQALYADIAERGVIVPVVVDEADQVLDGQHRLTIAASLGYLDVPLDVRRDLTEEDKEALAFDLNAHRRQMTREVRQAIAMRLRVMGKSYRDIGERLGVSDVTAMNDVREGAKYLAPDEMPAYVTGADGKQYPARRGEPSVLPFTTRPEQPRAEDWERPAFPVADEGPAPRAAHQHINASTSNEWYTPRRFLDAAHELMGGIDLDPASNALANQAVRATRYCTQDEDGYCQPWAGRVWLNPPYGKEGGESNQERWSRRLIEAYTAGAVSEALLLVNAVPGNLWFAPLWDFPICFVSQRIRFYNEQVEAGDPTHSNVIVYLGPQIARFVAIFSTFGPVAARLAADDTSVYVGLPRAA